MGKYVDVGEKGMSFDQVVAKIRAQYIARGYNYEEADRIARATAGKIFWEKFGSRGGSIISEALRKKRRKH